MVSLTNESTVLSGVVVKKCLQRTCILGLVLILALPVGSSAQTAAFNVNTPTLSPKTELVSINRTGTDGGNNDSILSSFPSPGSVLSADGRFVAFNSYASDLVANDTNGQTDVFVRDLQTGVTTLVSVNRFGTDSGNSRSTEGTISPDGRFVTFDSDASDLAPNDTNGQKDVFVRDLQMGTTTLVSINRAGTNTSNGSSDGGKISADGRFVVFESDASDLVANDTNGQTDVFVRDLQMGTTTLVSVNRFGTDSGNRGSGVNAISADGRFVAFRSEASDLVANDTNGKMDVFVRDLQTGTTTLISVNRFGTISGNSVTYNIGLSADGRFAVFSSEASDLVANDTNGQQDVFARDLQSGVTTLVSINRFGTNSGNGLSAGGLGSVSADGRFVAFQSDAGDLVANDTNGKMDVFVRDLQTGTTTLVSVNRFGTDSGFTSQNLGAINPNLSADGRFVAFESFQTDLLTNGTNGEGGNVFLRDLQTGTTTLLSVNRFGTYSGNGLSYEHALSADGHFVAFDSAASDLVENDSNNSSDVFVRSILTDSTPPVITPHIAGTPGTNGWYTSKVTVSWSVIDQESGIASSSGCADTTLTADTPKTTVTCSATNGAGMPASVTVSIKIDKTPPVITGLPATGCTLWPPNHKLVQVGTITASDATSGLASFDVQGTSNEASVPGEEDIVITGNGLQSRGVQLRAERSGAGIGRIYNLTAIAVDQAGNTTTSTATCTVPHDQGKK